MEFISFTVKFTLSPVKILPSLQTGENDSQTVIGNLLPSSLFIETN